MADIKKVLQGIEVCLQDNECTPCPYYREENDYFCGIKDILSDALELLKEQQETIQSQKEQILQEREWLLSMYDEAIELLNSKPQIVQCKDCKHRTEIRGIPSCELHFLKSYDNWFCADGKRR